MLCNPKKKDQPLFLAGDIGGTKTLLALYTLNDHELTLIRETKIASAEWQDLTPLIQSFLAENDFSPEDISAGCLSLAGPITEKQCLLTNLNRTIDFKLLQSTLNFKTPLLFVNDLEAMGHGLQILTTEDLLCLNPSVSKSSDKPNLHHTDLSLNRALIAPGTGLGVALIMNGNRVYPTEAGHTDFAPRTEMEVGLWRFLAEEFGHVSYEKILSGSGLVNIYRFLSQQKKSDFAELRESKTVNSPCAPAQPIPSPAEITKKALAGICPICTETLELFVNILGAEAGNLALRSLASGGIYLGGGIPPKILPKLREPFFLESFSAKGRFRDYLAQVPVYVILNERVALLGAALFARESSI